MKNRIRAVGEDWDDFKVVSQRIKIQHHIAVAQDFGIQLTAEDVVRVWGKGLRYETAAYYGHPDPANVSDEDHERYKAAFEARDPEFPKQLQPDTRVSHDRLVASGLPLFVVTSHITHNALKEMDMVGINPEDYLFVHGSDITAGVKPKPQAFDLAKGILASLDIAPEETIYGGDTLGDAISATEAGLQFLGVATGRTTAQEFNKNGFQSVPSLTEFTNYVIQRSLA